MKVVEINVREEYKKKFKAKQKDEYVLDLIFTSGLFPARLYYPAGVSLGGGYLSVLSSELWKASSLEEEGNFSPDKLIEFSFGKDLVFKDQQDFLEDKGEIIMVENRLSYENEVERILMELYPKVKVHHLLFDALKMQGKTYKILLHVGFLNVGRYYVRNTIGDMSGRILQEEKALIFPVFKNILSEILFKDQNLYLGWYLN